MLAKEIRSYPVVLRKQIQTYLTLNQEEVFKNGEIGCHPSVALNIMSEIYDSLEILELFLKNHFEETIDYHFHSEKYCHILSSIFVLSKENWKLIQGIFNFENSKKKFYHSWIEKDGIIFDPAMNLITLKPLYEKFFIKKYEYSKDEVIELFKRTSIFTYFKEDLENGILNPLGYAFLYDTPLAHSSATKFLTEFNHFLEQKTKNCNSFLNI